MGHSVLEHDYAYITQGNVEKYIYNLCSIFNADFLNYFPLNLLVNIFI